jgi:uncharacterized protein YegJ (DUF2314 family)
LSQRVLRSTNKQGRHWLTMETDPPLQIGPVAPNHCRIAYYILRAVYATLENLEEGDSVPEQIDIRMDEDEPWARVSLPMLPGPADWGGPDDPDEEPVYFLTVMPAQPAGEEVDTWIVPLAATLGLEPDPAIAEGGYEKAMRRAKEMTQAALPSVRARFLKTDSQDDERLRFGFKIGLATEDQGIEWVWIEPTSWQQPERLQATLESEPFDVPGHKQGQAMDVSAADIADYIVFDPRTEEKEGGFTNRVAADYGLFLPS